MKMKKKKDRKGSAVFVITHVNGSGRGRWAAVKSAVRYGMFLTVEMRTG